MSLIQRYKLAFTLVSLIFSFLAVSTISGCSTTAQLKGAPESNLLPKRGATVQIRNITMKVSKKYDVDVEKMLRDALGKALADQGLQWSGDPNAVRFIFNAEILDYEIGSAFGRWLVPGATPTILAIRGELRDPKDEMLAGTLEHKRGVYVGGLYTIGAWRTIFQSVSDDVAKELKIRINGEGFCVNLSPRSEQNVEIPIAKKPIGIKTNPLEDRRPDKARIGERSAAFGVSMGDVFFGRNVSEFLTETISDGGQYIPIGGDFLKFWLETKTTPLYWDIVGTIEIKLIFQPSRPDTKILERQYRATKVERTYVWPTKKLAGNVLEACIGNLMQQLHSDNIWPQEMISFEK
jgi:hypothetical protein